MNTPRSARSRLKVQESVDSGSCSFMLFLSFTNTITPSLVVTFGASLFPHLLLIGPWTQEISVEWGTVEGIWFLDDT